MKPDCSSIEIRNAFISLSKEHHPDIILASNNENSITKEDNLLYVNILEAYQVLGKQQSRDLYDSFLKVSLKYLYSFIDNILTLF